MAKERRRAVLELLQRPGNAHCADCGAPDPDWASYTLGVFICLSCSGIHRNIPQVSKVKSVRLDTWEEAQVEFMASHGNNAARATYESKVPSFYYRPTASDCQLLREQWIRAKYERQEFTRPEKQEPYSAGYREGFLWKRGRDNGQFLSRKFVLTEREGALKYFNRNDAKEPKAVMKIEHLNATFQPAKIGHPHGLQVTYLKDNSTRNIFVYHEDGKEMVDWFNALRAARFHYLQVAFPGASDADLVPKLSRNYLKEGYMEKTGPKKASGSAGSPWMTAGSCTSRTPWTPSPEGRSSSAARRAATRCWTGSRRPPRATTGHTASPSSRRSASSCWPARRSRSSGRGWRPSARSWTGPCCPRSTQWKRTSSINPSGDRPGGRGTGLTRRGRRGGGRMRGCGRRARASPCPTPRGSPDAAAGPEPQPPGPVSLEAHSGLPGLTSDPIMLLPRSVTPPPTPLPTDPPSLRPGPAPRRTCPDRRLGLGTEGQPACLPAHCHPAHVPRPPNTYLLSICCVSVVGRW
uniref:ArfGAP with dual PH domains 1 n=1 Tax=Equus caballus TaxID=9796 RepID=F6RVN3_HORSE